MDFLPFFWYNKCMENLANNFNTNTNNPYDNYYTPIQLILPVDLSIIINCDDPVYTFDKVLRGVNLEKYLVSDKIKDPRGRKGYNLVTLLKVVLFGFSLKGYVSTRELADLCVNDIRFRWLLRFEDSKPTHMTFCNFMNNYLLKNIDSIFKEINNYIFQYDNVDTEHLYIDGTKLEANANKYSWVWKKACITNRDKLFKKISEFLKEFNEFLLPHSVCFEIKDSYEIEHLEKMFNQVREILNIDPLLFVQGKGKRKTYEQKSYEFLNETIEQLKDYADKIEICGDNRNSYSKTDYDATFMRVKTDYMGNDQLLPAYNLQLGIADEYIAVMDINQFASDQSCFIPLMEKFNTLYGKYPKYPIADAGYGCFNNYHFCEEHNMEKFMKFPLFKKETTNKEFHNDPFRPINFKINDNGNLVCPNNREFIKISNKKADGLDSDRYVEYFKCKSCNKCKFRKQCHKSKDNRIIQINKTLSKYHQEVINNLSSIHGALLLMNRSIEAEGAFGIIKQDRFYKRIVRKGLDSVKLELFMIAVGFNIYKYHNKTHRRKVKITIL